ncbi:hypothetical protein JK2ML_0008 [Mycobacterium leprae Kyoto-2]|uniref:Uncharacterized protein n=3 Tax=Mycobacterium leprae TaxID=1769 RepID=Q9CDF1_MYCLE|nr:hypothetical protein DIJ64_00050 [Mycobacterium leprae]OAR19553.1 hypothetical protein A8144_04620 [Mycobacterium leprae 3125609]OAX71552.1 hypothetical protein A3216_05020 [Mycobacterium leprae 7935681]CAR70101.1 hypothetical protein MLBr00008 [Mycobacterium leprae Br4923]BBC16298.1 hypothetical protein JK2ML_0008 [Mycobacterium leprae Kyoto-2]
MATIRTVRNLKLCNPISDHSTRLLTVVVKQRSKAFRPSVLIRTWANQLEVNSAALAYNAGHQSSKAEGVNTDIARLQAQTDEEVYSRPISDNTEYGVGLSRSAICSRVSYGSECRSGNCLRYTK